MSSAGLLVVLITVVVVVDANAAVIVSADSHFHNAASLGIREEWMNW
jgi:hypothetical protein